MARRAQIAAAVIFGTFFVVALGQDISDEAKKDGPLAFTSLGYVRGKEGKTEQALSCSWTVSLIRCVA